MTFPRRFGPALLPLLLLVWPAAAQDAGDRASHIPIPRAPGDDLGKLIEQRIKQPKLRADLEKLLQQSLRQAPQGKDADRMMEQLQRLLDGHPEIRDLMESMNLNQPGGSDQLNGLIQGILNDNKAWQGLGLNADMIAKQLQKLPRPESTAGPRRAGGSPSSNRGDSPKPSSRSNGGNRPAPPPPAADPQEQAARQEWARSIGAWAQRFSQDKLPGALNNSPTLRNLIRDFNQAGLEAMGRGNGEGLDAQLAHWQSQLRAARDWLPTDWVEGMGERLADLPRADFHLPSIDWHLPSPSAPSVSFSAAAPAVDPVGVGQVALVVVALAVAVAVFWRLWAVRAAPAGAARRRALGPWPLDPAAVASRADLIRAFEYLSLARCGEAARSWHHRAIAERLGGAEAARCAAAAGLARLYEQARYAPADHPEPDWTAARRPLTFLAGTGS